MHMYVFTVCVYNMFACLSSTTVCLGNLSVQYICLLSICFAQVELFVYLSVSFAWSR
jgi:hypothetical protein